MQFNLNDDVRFILKQLNKNGTGFLVGGALRDLTLGNDPEDYDFATDIEYKKLKNIFKEYNPKEIGTHFGIIMININGKEYEIAKFRQESGIYNSRYPKSIKFVNNINIDLKRRDFTMNSLAYNEEVGLIDLFGSLNDIKNKSIKFVGNPKLRIEEDSLRIMRAFRFMSKLGFNLEKKTSEAIYEKRKFLNKISRERIFDELKMILLGKNVKKTLIEMKKLGILELIIPEFKYTYGVFIKKENLFKSIINTVEHTPVDTITRLSALFFNLGKINTKTIDAKGSISYDGYEKESALIAEIQLKHLKASNEIIYSVKKIVRNFTLLYKNSKKKELKKIALDFGDKNLERLFDLMNANLNSKRTIFKNRKMKVQNLIERMNLIKREGPIPSIKDVNITGVDLINLKFESKNIGKLKSEVYEMILEEKLKNDKKDIIFYLMNKYRNGYNLESEKSCGAVIYNQNLEKYLIVKMYNGNWGFPKGHVEKNETEIETAIREVKEETNIDIEIKEIFRETIKYVTNEKTIKEVVFFLGIVNNEQIKIDANEIEDFEWCTYEEALKLITYKVQRDVLEKVKKYIKEREDKENIILYI